MTFACVSFNRKSSFGFGIWDIVLTFCRCGVTFFVHFRLLLRVLKREFRTASKSNISKFRWPKFNWRTIIIVCICIILLSLITGLNTKPILTLPTISTGLVTTLSEYMSPILISLINNTIFMKATFCSMTLILYILIYIIFRNTRFSDRFNKTNITIACLTLIYLSILTTIFPSFIPNIDHSLYMNTFIFFTRAVAILFISCMVKKEKKDFYDKALIVLEKVAINIIFFTLGWLFFLILQISQLNIDWSVLQSISLVIGNSLLYYGEGVASSSNVPDANTRPANNTGQGEPASEEPDTEIKVRYREGIPLGGLCPRQMNKVLSNMTVEMQESTKNFRHLPAGTISTRLCRISLKVHDPDSKYSWGELQVIAFLLFGTICPNQTPVIKYPPNWNIRGSVRNAQSVVYRSVSGRDTRTSTAWTRLIDTSAIKNSDWYDLSPQAQVTQSGPSTSATTTQSAPSNRLPARDDRMGIQDILNDD